MPLGEPRSILVACDKFKGSLDAREACDAVARGLSRKFPRAVVEVFPIADGGEGFAAALEHPLAGKWITAPSHDALGRPITARYLLVNSIDSADGPMAVLEMAEASGMWRIRDLAPDVLHASTFGTGELMRHAVEQSGARHLVVGLGGSATNDGGAGMAAALGVRFLDGEGRELQAVPGTLHGILRGVDRSAMLALPRVTMACDVNNPLLGAQGATRVFGQQKGASAKDLEVLEETLTSLVAVCGAEECASRPGAGAAGGLGFGLMHFTNAAMVPGFEWIASHTGLRGKIASADLVATGEGSLDAQSLGGKGPVAIARMARQLGTPVVAFCGAANDSIRSSGLFDAISALADSGLPLDELIPRAAELLESTASGEESPAEPC